MSSAKGRTRTKGKQEGLPLSGQRRLHRGVIAELTFRRGVEGWQMRQGQEFQAKDMEEKTKRCI